MHDQPDQMEWPLNDPRTEWQAATADAVDVSNLPAGATRNAYGFAGAHSAPACCPSRE